MEKLKMLILIFILTKLEKKNEHINASFLTLSSTFAKHTKQSLKPNFAKELFSPSHADTRTK